MLNLPEDTLPCSLQAPLPVPTEVTSICSVMDPIKEGKVCWLLHITESMKTKGKGGETHNRLTTLAIDILLQ